MTALPPAAKIVFLLSGMVDAATRLDATLFTSPVGYQTNLFVCGPGGDDFGDSIRVGRRPSRNLSHAFPDWHD